MHQPFSVYRQTPESGLREIASRLLETHQVDLQIIDQIDDENVGNILTTEAMDELVVLMLQDAMREAVARTTQINGKSVVPTINEILGSLGKIGGVEIDSALTTEIQIILQDDYFEWPLALQQGRNIMLNGMALVVFGPIVGFIIQIFFLDIQRIRFRDDFDLADHLVQVINEIGGTYVSGDTIFLIMTVITYQVLVRAAAHMVGDTGLIEASKALLFIPDNRDRKMLTQVLARQINSQVITIRDVLREIEELRSEISKLKNQPSDFPLQTQATILEIKAEMYILTQMLKELVAGNPPEFIYQLNGGTHLLTYENHEHRRKDYKTIVIDEEFAEVTHSAGEEQRSPEPDQMDKAAEKELLAIEEAQHAENVTKYYHRTS